MPILQVIVVMVVLGVVLWLVNTYIPMDGNIKKVLNIAVVIILVLWLLTMFLGGLGSLDAIRIGPVR